MVETHKIVVVQGFGDTPEVAHFHDYVVKSLNRHGHKAERHDPGWHRDINIDDMVDALRSRIDLTLPTSFLATSIAGSLAALASIDQPHVRRVVAVSARMNYQRGQNASTVELNRLDAIGKTGVTVLNALKDKCHKLIPGKVVVIIPKSGDRIVSLNSTVLPNVRRLIYPCDARNHIDGIVRIMCDKNGIAILLRLLTSEVDPKNWTVA